MFGSASWSYYLNIFSSSHLEVGIGKHLNQPFILIYKISITRSRHPDVKCRKRQTRSEMWIHRNLSGKDRSSSHSIKTLYPLSGPSDHVHKNYEICNNVMPLLTRLLSKNRPQLIEKRTHIIAWTKKLFECWKGRLKYWLSDLIHQKPLQLVFLTNNDNHSKNCFFKVQIEEYFFQYRWNMLELVLGQGTYVSYWLRERW